MLREIRPAIIVLVLLTLVTGLGYPLAITAIAGAVFPKQAQGSLVEKDGKVVGSALIGQEFKDDKYFHGRPSATTAPDPADASKTVAAPYNAANSGGSNSGRPARPSTTGSRRTSTGSRPRIRRSPFRSISSPRPAAASIRISRRKPRCSRCRGSPRRAICRKTASASLSPTRPKTGLPGCSASPASTCSRSIWRWMRLQPGDGS